MKFTWRPWRRRRVTDPAEKSAAKSEAAELAQAEHLLRALRKRVEITEQSLGDQHVRYHPDNGTHLDTGSVTG